MARNKREWTERWWLRSTDYTTMMKFMGARLSERKQLLFGCATARRVWDYVIEPENRKAVQTSEAHADGKATLEELQNAWHRLRWEEAMYSEWHIDAVTAGVGYNEPGRLRNKRARPGSLERMPKEWADALRDIAGNPFQEVTFRPEWLVANDGIAVGLAESIYDEHAFDRLPILADALEDAGCDDTILGHLRSPGPHVRGCWVVDRLLGKK